VTNKNRHCFTLPKHKILRGERAIKRLFESGTFSKGKWFDVVYLYHAGFNEGKSAFAASRRARNAVERNRIKRKLREAFRLEQIILPASCCVIVIGNTKILKVEAGAVRVEMNRVFNLAGLMILPTCATHP